MLVEQPVCGGDNRARGVPRDRRARLGRRARGVLERVKADHVVMLLAPRDIVAVKGLSGDVAVELLFEEGRAPQQEGVELLGAPQAISFGRRARADAAGLRLALLKARLLRALVRETEGISLRVSLLARHRAPPAGSHLPSLPSEVVEGGRQHGLPPTVGWESCKETTWYLYLRTSYICGKKKRKLIGNHNQKKLPK